MSLGDWAALSVFVALVAGLGMVIRNSQRRLVVHRLRKLLGAELGELPIVRYAFAALDLPDLHVALEQYLARSEVRSHQVLGTNPPDPALSEIVTSSIFGGPLGQVRVGPPQYRQVYIDVEEQMRCLEHGLYLIKTNEGGIALNIRRDAYFSPRGLELEIVSNPPELAGPFLETIQSMVTQESVYRGKVITFEGAHDEYIAPSATNIRFHHLPKVERDDIVLPEETIRLIERNTVSFFRHSAALKKSGRSLKRGLLLHGKPGTGKTLTAKWLAQSLDRVTVILLSGEQLALVKDSFALARRLAPALIIMEDADLITEDRESFSGKGAQAILHTLLNELDGLAAESEVMLLLTTNRPEVLETALAQRPGRVDQAVEFPLPDSDGRRRLLKLYARGLTIRLDDEDRLIEKTAGASPAFMKELVRKSALVAAENDSMNGESLLVTDEHFDVALPEMLLGSGALTRNLIGFERA